MDWGIDWFDKEETMVFTSKYSDFPVDFPTIQFSEYGSVPICSISLLLSSKPTACNGK